MKRCATVLGLMAVLLAGRGTACAQERAIRASLSPERGEERSRRPDALHRLELSLGRSSPLKSKGESGMSFGGSYLFHAIPEIGIGLGLERFSLGYENPIGRGFRNEATILSYAALAEFVAFPERRVQPTLRAGVGGFNADIREDQISCVTIPCRAHTIEKTRGPAPMALVGLGVRVSLSARLFAGFRATLRFMDAGFEYGDKTLAADATLDIAGLIGVRF